MFFVKTSIHHKKADAHAPKDVCVYFVNSIFNSNFLLKIDFYPNSQLNLICNSLKRFRILKKKSIMEIQFLN